MIYNPRLLWQEQNGYTTPPARPVASRRQVNRLGAVLVCRKRACKPATNVPLPGQRMLYSTRCVWFSSGGICSASRRLRHGLNELWKRSRELACDLRGADDHRRLRLYMVFLLVHHSTPLQNHPSFTMKRARLPCHFEPLISAGSAAIPVIGSSAYAPIRLASSGNCGVCEYSTGNPLNKLCLPSAALQARPICVGIARTSERELPNLTFARHITGRDSRRCGSVPAQSVATARARGHCDAE
jgi:hypothetical protein